MTKKDLIQEDIINKIIDSKFSGIVESSVRSGKTRILLNSVKRYSELIMINNPNILVLYPNIDIKTSWEKECEILEYFPNITYCTFISVDKVKDIDWDFVIIDECHLIPKENILPIIGNMCQKLKHVILASGTISFKTLVDIKYYTKLSVIVNYNTEDAIKDEIICDYQIIVYEYELDSTNLVEFGKTKKWKSTELKECNRLSYKVDTTQGKEKMFNALNRMRFINSCSSLVNNVKKWINSNTDLRFILFTGDENVGKKYNIPMYNSKSKDDLVLKQFQNEEINQICLIKKGKQGITFKSLQHILITAIDSNSENLSQALGRALLNDTENAIIHIFVSNQQFQKKWLTSALTGINQNKIQWKKI